MQYKDSEAIQKKTNLYIMMVLKSQTAGFITLNIFTTVVI